MQQSSIVSSLNELREQSKRTESASLDKLEGLRTEILNILIALVPLDQQSTITNKRAEPRKANRLHALRVDLDAAKKRNNITGNESAQMNISPLLGAFIREGKQVATSQQILDSLYFKELKEREANVKNSHAKTYHWMFTRNGPHHDVNFMDWLESGSSVYWIAGKAGSGKSTLMKMLCNHERTREALQLWAGKENRLIVASHFFWSGGNQMQKSQSGLLRSLLYQILWQYPALIETVLPQRWEADGWMAPNYWKDEELSAAFDQLSEQGSKHVKICIFVDGVDEYNGNHKDIISVLQQAAGRSQDVKVCLSSRPWNVFQNAFGENQNRMMLQKHTTNDIRNYTTDTLYKDEQFTKLARRDQRAKGLINQITEKANGVFLWVFLVVRSLLLGLTDDNEISELQKRVHDLPEDLESYFKLMLHTIEPFYRAQTAHIFLISVQATRPQSVLAYSFLEDVVKDADFALGKISPITDEQILSILDRQRKSLNARCKDFLEITEDLGECLALRYKVGFLHRTVRDFLTTSDVYEDFKNKAVPNFDARKILCRVHLAQIKSFPLQNIRNSIHTIKSLGYLLVEFLHDVYEIEMYHDAAEMAHMDELEQVMSSAYHYSPSVFQVQWTDWLDETCVHKEATSILSTAVQARLHKYVTNKLDENPCLNFEERPQPLLNRALERSAWARDWLPTSESYFDLEMARLLLERGANPNGKVSVRQDITVWNAFLLKCPDNPREADARTRDHQYKKKLFHIAEMLVEHGADVDLKNEAVGYSFRGISSPRPTATEILQESLEPVDWAKLEVLMAEKRQLRVGRWLRWFGRR